MGLPALVLSVACVGEIKPTNIFDQHMWLDRIPEGDLAAGPLNPLLWSSK